tara:strand:+ start:874 stop:1791 length:918 start_codon:yes stop_codon:yes gene_type:complete
MKIKEKLNDIVSGLVKSMETAGTDWVKSWAGNGSINLVTKKGYRGINVLLLGYAKMKRCFKSGIWASFKQWNDKGYMVSGQSESIIFFKQTQKKIVDDDTGDTLLGDTYWMTRYYNVWNADQVISKNYLDWITCNYRYKEPVKTASEVEDNTDIDKYIENTGAVIKHGFDGAFYSPALDYIGMPDKSAFIDTKDADSTGNYYGTKLHELSHWTGHKKRLNRFGKAPKAFADNDYAYEELVAEISSAMLSIELGLDHEPRPDHAKYLNCWIARLKDDSGALISASTKAQQVLDYLDDMQDKKKAVA